MAALSCGSCFQQREEMMDQNKYSDEAYEVHAKSALRALARDFGIVFGFFFFFAAGYVTALMMH
jgi:hypothetical protein